MKTLMDEVCLGWGHGRVHAKEIQRAFSHQEETRMRETLSKILVHGITTVARRVKLLESLMIHRNRRPYRMRPDLSRKSAAGTADRQRAVFTRKALLIRLAVTLATILLVLAVIVVARDIYSWLEMIKAVERL